MPTVPRARRQVATEPLRGPRVPTEVPRAAFGVDRTPDLSPIVRVAQDHYQQEREKADQIALLDADNQLTEYRRLLLNDPNSGVLSQRGKNALAASEGVRDQFQKRVSEIEKGLHGDSQVFRFRQLAHGHGREIDAQVERHVRTEVEALDHSTTESALKLAFDDAVQANDEGTIQQTIDRAGIILDGFAQRRGFSPEQKEQYRKSFVSRVHSAVIERALDDERDLDAERYLKAHRKELVGDDLLRAERLTQEGSTRATSQKEADAIVAKETSLAGALEAARLITEPKVRDAVEVRIRRHFADKAADARLEQDLAFDEASKTLERTKRVEAIPFRIREKLSPSQLSSLTHREEQLRHPKRTTDMSLYTTLVTMAGLNENTMREFEGMNLAQFYQQLDDDDFNRLVGLQRSLRSEGFQQRTDRPDADTQLPGDVRLSVPQQWVDSAATNPAYLRYLRTLRVVPQGGTGNIDLGADTTRKP